MERVEESEKKKKTKRQKLPVPSLKVHWTITKWMGWRLSTASFSRSTCLLSNRGEEFRKNSDPKGEVFGRTKHIVAFIYLFCCICDYTINVCHCTKARDETITHTQTLWSNLVAILFVWPFFLLSTSLFFFFEAQREREHQAVKVKSSLNKVKPRFLDPPSEEVFGRLSTEKILFRLQYRLNKR